MTRDLHPTRATFSARLHAGRPLRLVAAGGCRVRVDAGSVWITAEGMFADVFAHAGDSFTVPGDGLTLVEALGTAQVTVFPAASPAADNGAQIHANRDLTPVGRIKSAVSFRLSTALRAPVLAALRGLLRSPRFH